MRVLPPRHTLRHLLNFRKIRRKGREITDQDPILVDLAKDLEDRQKGLQISDHTRREAINVTILLTFRRRSEEVSALRLQSENRKLTCFR